MHFDPWTSTLASEPYTIFYLSTRKWVSFVLLLKLISHIFVTVAYSQNVFGSSCGHADTLSYHTAQHTEFVQGVDNIKPVVFGLRFAHCMTYRVKDNLDVTRAVRKILEWATRQILLNYALLPHDVAPCYGGGGRLTVLECTHKVSERE